MVSLVEIMSVETLCWYRMMVVCRCCCLRLGLARKLAILTGREQRQLSPGGPVMWQREGGLGGACVGKCEGRVAIAGAFGARHVERRQDALQRVCAQRFVAREPRVERCALVRRRRRRRRGAGTIGEMEKLSTTISLCFAFRPAFFADDVGDFASLEESDVTIGSIKSWPLSRMPTRTSRGRF